jgi:PAS domain S-box-containing protein
MVSNFSKLISDQIKVISQTPIAIAFLDKNLRYVSHTSKWSSKFKLAYKDVRGMYHYDIFPELPAEWKAAHKNALNGLNITLENEYFPIKNGATRWLKWNIKAWTDYDNNIAGILIAVEDLTSRVYLQDRFSTIQRLLFDASINNEIGTWHYDLLKDKLIWSDQAKKIHEVSKSYDPKADQAINFYKDGDSRKKITEAFINGFTKGIPFDLKLQLITAKGNEIWVRSAGISEVKNAVCTRQYGIIKQISKDTKI